jgi:type IX secretion system PorP/SprF family membrane protein
MRLIGIILCIGILSVTEVSSQQLPVYSQYTFNPFLLNPAAAGAEGYTAINLTSREQWLGIDGAPTTNAVSVQTRIYKRNYVSSNSSVHQRYLAPLRSGKVGLAAYIYNDHAGLIDQTGGQFTYAYHIYRNQSQLSFGLTFCIFQFRINKSNQHPGNINDKLLDNQRLWMIIPDVNAGIYYTDLKSFLGISAFNLSKATVRYSNNRSAEYVLLRHYYLTGGFKIDLPQSWLLEPSVNIKTSEQWKWQFDLMVKCINSGKYWCGLGYRTNKTAIITLGIKLSRLYVGYSYDYNFTGLSYYTTGTHELMLTLKLGDHVRRYPWMERY